MWLQRWLEALLGWVLFKMSPRQIPPKGQALLDPEEYTNTLAFPSTTAQSVAVKHFSLNLIKNGWYLVLMLS